MTANGKSCPCVTQRRLNVTVNRIMGWENPMGNAVHPRSLPHSKCNRQAGWMLTGIFTQDRAQCRKVCIPHTVTREAEIIFLNNCLWEISIKQHYECLPEGCVKKVGWLYRK